MKAVKRVSKRPKNQADLAPSHARSKNATASKITPPTTVEIGGIPIHFPFKPYAVQFDYMKTVIEALNRSENALLESPTGTGKTLCLLCSAIAWQREQSVAMSQLAPSSSQPSSQTDNHSASQSFQGDQQSSTALAAATLPARKTPTIIYASRTHSQLSQVVRELRNTRYRPKHAVLGSREQMCVNPKVKKAGSTSSEINHDCSKLIKDRRCTFKKNLEGFSAPSNESGLSGMQPVMDMEDLLQMGTNYKVCPFYYTRSHLEGAELILVPYNYLFDKDARKTTLADVPWDNSVIIFDEAHNLESFASESASFDLTSTDIAGCIREVERGLGYVQANHEFQSRANPDNIVRLKALFMNLEEYILGLPTDKSAFPGAKMMEIFQEGASITFVNYELFMSEVRSLAEIFLDVQGGTGSKGAPRLEHFLQCLKRVFGETSEARCIAKSKSYRVHVSPKSKAEPNGTIQKGRTVSYWCFAPSEAMRELAGLNVRSILVTSGTLSPMESYALELDLPFPHRLENPHIIPDDQIHVQVVEKGVSGKVLTSTYARRQEEDYYSELGATLVSLSRVIPGGMLVFFPSYSMMETCIERWGGPTSNRYHSRQNPSNFFAARKPKAAKNNSRYSFPRVALPVGGLKTPASVWKRLLDRKSIVLEPKTSSELPNAIAEFRKYLDQPKSPGCSIFGVCRGKISEGIDFADDMCRAVVITGLPFAPYKDPKVQMKREFLDTNRNQGNMKASDKGGFDKTTGRSFLSGQEWYAQGAHRAINQAVGRVIRNIHDYGAILLLDSRFAQPSQSNGLSKWVRPHIRQDQGMGVTIGGLVKFFKTAKAKASNRQRAPLPVPQPPNNVKMILQYEDEGSQPNRPEKPTRVAYIQKDNKADHDDIGRSFIPSKDIVERIDFKEDRDIATRPVVAAGLKSVSKNLFTSVPGAKLEDLYSRKRSGAQPIEQPKPAKKRQQQPINGPFSGEKSKEPAEGNKAIITKFFGMVRSKLGVEDQTIVKKSLVAMHRHASKDRSSYLRSAADLVQILCKSEPLEEMSTPGKSMLDHLLQILPPNYQVDVQKMAVHQHITQSSFGKLCKQVLDHAECKRFFAVINALLLNVWYAADNDQVTTKEFLEKIRTLHQRFAKTDALSASSALQQFSKLLPTKHSRACSALVEGTDAEGRVRRMKESERSRMGEDSIDLDRFRRVLPIERIEASRKMRQEAMTSVDNGAPSAPPPSKSHGAQPNNGLQDNSSSQCAEKSSESFMSIRKMIKTAESQTFVGQVRSNKRRTVNSNAPKDLRCAICDTSCDQPYIAECGHMSCLQCWFEWLSKSKTCPVCRAPTTSTTLAQVVFKEKDE